MLRFVTIPAAFVFIASTALAQAPAKGDPAKPAPAAAPEAKKAAPAPAPTAAAPAAADAKGTPAPAADAKKADNKKPEAAKPDPAVVAELKAKRDALKEMLKPAKCEGTMVSPEGETKMTFKMKGKAVADGAWIQTSKDFAKPTKRKQEGLLGWDSGAGTYRHFEVSSEGRSSTCTSPGWVGETIEWSCDTVGADGKPSKRKMVTTKKGPKVFETVGEVQGADGTWTKMVGSTCKI
jgi:hypothetical protein